MTDKTNDPVIVSAVRTPIGDFGGSLKSVGHEQLAVTVLKEVCERIDFSKDLIDDVYWGVVMVRSDENGLARGAVLKAGYPEHVTAVQVNRACCSSMEAIRIAAMEIRLGESQAVVAGGGESMSNVSYSIKNARWGLGWRHQELSDGIWDGLFDHHTGLVMGMTAENVAHKYGITRQMQDQFAYTSQMRAKKALETGRFKDEIVPVRIPGKKGKPDKIVDTDEHPRPQTTMEALSRLPPSFKKDGSVTAGNASGLNDGASAVLVISKAMADQYGMSRQWRVAGSAAVGVDPTMMGIGPVDAIRKLFKQTGYGINDIELIEINEAFAAPSVGVE
jgi:acetyl-CoA C-acetyltransferase